MLEGCSAREKKILTQVEGAYTSAYDCESRGTELTRHIQANTALANLATPKLDFLRVYLYSLPNGVKPASTTPQSTYNYFRNCSNYFHKLFASSSLFTDQGQHFLRGGVGISSKSCRKNLSLSLSLAVPNVISRSWNNLWTNYA